MSRRHTLAACAGAAGLAFALLVAPAALAAASASFTFARLDRAYTDVAPGSVPWSSGPLSIVLASPRHTVLLRSHRLTLAPAGDGSHLATLEVDFQGKGWLTADVAVLGQGTQLADELLLPPQRRSLRGRVRIARAADGGFLVTPLELPPTLPVAIRSRVGNEVTGWCEGLAMVPFSGVDCEPLAALFESVAVPLPRSGQPFHLAAEELAPAEREALAAYLAGAAAPR